jgi:hypothetical protein
MAAARTTKAASFTRKRPSRSWKVIRHVREKFTCRDTAAPTSGRCLRWKDPHRDIPPTVEASAGEIKKYSKWRNQAAAWRFFSRLDLMEAPQERSNRPKGFVVEILTFEYWLANEEISSWIARSIVEISRPNAFA